MLATLNTYFDGESTMDRDEIISQLVKEYGAELRTLTDDELYEHFRLQREVSQLTDRDWMEIAVKASRTQS
jgi:hypothetical protein